MRGQWTFFNKATAFDSKQMAGREDMDFPRLKAGAGIGPHKRQAALAREDINKVALACGWKMAGNHEGNLKIAGDLRKKGAKSLDASG
jgi:hypothetical protein